MEKGIISRDLKFVEYSAIRLRDDNRLFLLQKKLIESYFHSLNNHFKNRFGNKNFKENAGKYLKGIGLI